jgi:hypothetical protein
MSKIKFQILSSNTKLEKSVAFARVITAGLFLAPHRRSGHNVCTMAGVCSLVCNLWFSGRTVSGPVRSAMLNRTALFFDNPAEFFDRIYSDLCKLSRIALRDQLIAYVRLNGASDLDMRRYAREFEGWDHLRFYDYTKRPDFVRMILDGVEWPTNYTLTYSWSERADVKLAVKHLKSGGNVSVVFDTEYCPQHNRIGTLPDRVRLPGSRVWFPVVDGDKHDLRHPDFDGCGNVVGLRFKGSRKLLEHATRKGFVLKG